MKRIEGRRTMAFVAAAAVATAAIFAMGLAMSSGTARAGVTSYCFTQISSGTWCGRNSERHTYHGQIVELVSSSNQICERMISSSTRRIRSPGPTCSGGGDGYHDYCYTGRGQTGILYEAEAKQDSSGSREIQAFAAYGSGDPNFC